MEMLYNISVWILPLMLAIILHEIAHGWAALYFGDPTAKQAGRLTLNPIKHIDRTGTIILPALLVLLKSPVVFGYAKPVPVDFSSLNPLRLGTICVAIAGPATNFLLAIIAGFLLPHQQNEWIIDNITNMLVINCVLMLFNLIPLPPLDGGRVVAAIFTRTPQIWFAKYDRAGMAILFMLLLLPSFFGFNLASKILETPVLWTVTQILLLTGNDLAMLK